MSKFIKYPYCQNTYFWVESCNCQIHVYYDYLENTIHVSFAAEKDWPTDCGDYNLVYLGEL